MEELQLQETEEDKVMMMCWENMDGFLAEEPNEETGNLDERADNKMVNQIMKKNMLIIHYIWATD